MKKSAAAIVLLSLLSLLSAGACGSSDRQGGAPGFALDVPALGEKLYRELSYRDQLEELDPQIVYTLLGVDGSHVAAQKNYFSSGATAEEIIVFQAADREALLALRKAVEARIEDQSSIYASYAPEEVAYLKGAVVEEKGDYLIYCVAEDAQAARKMIAEALR